MNNRQQATGNRQKVQAFFSNAYFLVPNACRSNRGFTLLLAALVSSITLAIGVSIFEITQKQVILSSLGRDSQFAFYAADTGAECALYWDVKHAAFSTTTPITPITCASTVNGEPNIAVTHGSLNSYPITFTLADFTIGTYCARVKVTKNEANPKTVIHSDGYSTDCESIATNPRALQRSVEIKY
ncbi:MAG: hypothetical protein NUV88_00425 [Candidatus Kaiserbacteria bacterium]|nr:hypothetical protein [Candidatus Kaiserbacteria bacterium]